MILECLKVLQKAQSRDDGWKSLYSKSVQDFAIPGDSSFPINAYFHKPRSSQEAQKMKDYLKVRRPKIPDNDLILFSASSTWNCYPHAWYCIRRQRKTKQMVDVFHKKKVSLVTWVVIISCFTKQSISFYILELFQESKIIS